MSGKDRGAWKWNVLAVLNAVIVAVMAISAWREEGLLPFLTVAICIVFVAAIIWREHRRQF